jgi:outer membrane protein TolC
VTAAEQQAYEAEKKKLDAGKSTSFNVLKIASDLTAAQVAEIAVIVSYNQALSDLAFNKGVTFERWHVNRPARGDR